MTTAQRLSIIEEAESLIQKEVFDYPSLSRDEQEILMDEAINRVCDQISLDSSKYWAVNRKVTKQMLQNL